MIVFELLRKVNRHVKDYKKRNAGKYLAPVRRIERVYPLNNSKWCAMTFDDGPSSVPPNPYLSEADLKRIGLDPKNTSAGLSEVIKATLNTFDGKGTFDSIGTTEENYPDERGKINTAKWGGKRHDHYPDLGKDAFGGLFNHPNFSKDLVNEGHAIANHGGRHVLFGPIRMIYDTRSTLSDLDAVLEDLTLLHNHVYDTLNYSIAYSRPPHYIDKINGGYSAYDAYAIMGYQYLAASFDGGGWKPSSGNYENDVKAMVQPMREALENDPNALNGQIVFQKDGCNMSLQTPVAHALYQQLELLKSYGYQVVTVDELMAQSPFEDYGMAHEGFVYARMLHRSGYMVAYKNNTFQPDRIITFGELLTMTTPKDLYVANSVLKHSSRRSDFDYDRFDLDAIHAQIGPVKSKHVYALNYKYAKHKGYLVGFDGYDLDSELQSDEVIRFLNNVKKVNGVIDENDTIRKLFNGEEGKVPRKKITEALCFALKLKS